jgi:hypothetical protein
MMRGHDSVRVRLIGCRSYAMNVPAATASQHSRSRSTKPLKEDGAHDDDPRDERNPA